MFGNPFGGKKEETENLLVSRRGLCDRSADRLPDAFAEPTYGVGKVAALRATGLPHNIPSR
jgi:hypothetical protein